MNQPQYFPRWQDEIVYSAAGPQPQILYEDNRKKVVLVGLEPGAQIPDHPGDAGVYHFLEGSAQMRVESETYEVEAGGIVIVPAGATRGMSAHTRLALIAVRTV